MPGNVFGCPEWDVEMVEGREIGEWFAGFVDQAEPKLRHAFVVALGQDVGVEATSIALAYGWEHRDELFAMDNPAGYLYVVGRNRGRKRLRRRGGLVLIPVDDQRTPWVEPDLPDALSALPEQQRVVVMLLHCFEWTMGEVGDVLQVSKSTVQTHADRGLARLRERMGVTL